MIFLPINRREFLAYAEENHIIFLRWGYDEAGSYTESSP
jgi:hypothetical protein